MRRRATARPVRRGQLRGRRRAAESLLVDLSRKESPGALRDLLAVALRDPSLRVGFWVSPLSGYVDAAGRHVDVDDLPPGHVASHITGDGEPLAVFVSNGTSARNPAVLDAVLGAARAALENERLHAELRAQLDQVRASRQRLVSAADDERKRIERNLHDGAQQRLVSLTMSLRLLRLQLDGAGDAVVQALDELERELMTAIDELRELARGIHPAILTDEGLHAALRSLADRTSVPVHVSGAPRGRQPAAVEAAAYFVCCEAVTNAVRHANASAIEIELAEEAGRLAVAVVDDGLGGADPRGSGLRGLSDRVAALGGDLSVLSAPGGGTRVAALLPLEGG